METADFAAWNDSSIAGDQGTAFRGPPAPFRQSVRGARMRAAPGMNRR